MNKILYILITIILILVISLLLLTKNRSNILADKVRWENNYQESLDSIQRISLTYNEFKENKTKEVDSLLKELDIRSKKVERIITITNTLESVDTIYIPLIQYTTIDSNILKFKEDYKCISVEGNIYTMDPDTKLSVTDFKYENQTNYIAYWDRNRYKFLGLFYTKFLGRKIGKLEVSSKCGGVKVKEIDIIKNK